MTHPRNTVRNVCILVIGLFGCLSLSLPARAAEEEEAEAAAKPHSSAGLDPRAPKVKDQIVTKEAPKLTISTSKEDWKPGFHGYLRAPMSIGWHQEAVRNGDGDKVGDDVVVHAPPAVPDVSYTNWQYLGNVVGPWAELMFSYGNSRVTGNVSVAAWNITDAGYRNLKSQLGIDQAFVSMEFPKAFGKVGGLTWNVGAFQNRYGAAGRYDAGKYDTYLFGRTHTAGETLSAYFILNNNLSLQVEHGFGAKLDVIQSWSATPNDPRWMPYGGEVQQGMGMVNHGHLGLTIEGLPLSESMQFRAHLIHAFTNDADASSLEDDNPNNDEKDARLIVTGGEIKWFGGVLGDGYLGFSYIDTKNLARMPSVLETIHSNEGWNWLDNYFAGQDATSGTGNIKTLAFQYIFSLATVFYYPKKFWGQGPDLQLAIFGMANFIEDKDPTYVDNSGDDPINVTPHVAKTKLKFGGEATYVPLKWMGFGARYDLVQPDMSDKDLSFHVISARLLFRTEFVTHEQVTLQYSRYVNGDKVVPGFPYESSDPADPNVFQISITMWW